MSPGGPLLYRSPPPFPSLTLYGGKAFGSGVSQMTEFPPAAMSEKPMMEPISDWPEATLSS